MRVTQKMLESKVESLNQWLGFTNGAWVKKGDKFESVPGAYVLDCAYGGYRLCQIVGTGGGERDITGRASAKETAYLISAYWQGMLAGERKAKGE